MSSDVQYNPYSGRVVVPGVVDSLSHAASLGLEPPRFCEHCGRRTVVQVTPNGWTSVCSRHGELDSSTLGRR
ncbi:hypothetical protein QMK17_07245 [Rhodococcus sp. G-MC3]|uniref:biotin synthase auxiliary protein BsaP n=1 Tax=Rhodococcus sp. G-MC3 TaxID=3046209 RepID=UPI0024BA2DF0|nr:hypothetical protein [Rhodococcus sp. G-MC3]MDJ0393125.1 hypothetical protein [Rhodococcus sp. G-MC3]